VQVTGVHRVFVQSAANFVQEKKRRPWLPCVLISACGCKFKLTRESETGRP
jgi:hypothetical protein